MTTERAPAYAGHQEHSCPVCLNVHGGEAAGPAPLDADLREAAGLLADACRRYFEGEAKAVVNIQPLVERIERRLAASDKGSDQ